MAKIAEALAENLLRLRRKKKLSQEALGSAVGVTRQTIWSYEKAEGHINLDTIQKIAAALEAEETDLVESPDAAAAAGLFRAMLAEFKNSGVLPGFESEIGKAAMKAGLLEFAARRYPPAEPPEEHYAPTALPADPLVKTKLVAQGKGDLDAAVAIVQSFSASELRVFVEEWRERLEQLKRRSTDAG